MQKAHVICNASISPIKPLNSELTLAKCRVMALGKNRNLSYFSKEAVESALPTLANIPVVGHVYSDEDGKLRLGGHDAEIVSEEGTYKFRSVCVPWGCVPENHNAHFEEVEEQDGTKATYLVADIILWNRFEDVFKTFYSDEVYANQSMEINVSSYAPYAEDKNYTDIQGYEFSALCMLNRGDSEDDPNNVTPCFPSSDIAPYKFEYDENFYEMTAQFKEALALCFDKNSKEGGTYQMTNEVIEAILEEFSLSKEDLNFEITEEMTEEEFRANVEELCAANDTPEENEPVSFSATYREKREALEKMLEPVVNADEEGNVNEEIYYWVNDFDDTYVFVEKSTWTPSNYNCEHGRIKYTFDEESRTAKAESEFELMVLKWLTVEENQKVEDERAEYEELKEYKACRIKQDHDAEIDGVVSEFADITGSAEFGELKPTIYEIENADALREKLFAIRGKLAPVSNGKKTKTDSGKVPVAKAHEDVDPTAAFFAYYKNK